MTHSESQIRNFFDKLKVARPYIIEAQRQIDKAIAPRFRLMQPYIRPNENMISLIMRDLLDPQGTHGQERLFLSLFLNVIGAELEVHKDEFVHVQCEATTNNNRRIDILITGTDWVIAVENKPWAHEQEGQLKDYWMHIEEKIDKPHKMLIFLAGYDLAPKTIDRKFFEKKYKDKYSYDNTVKSLPYISGNNGHSLTNWLENCQRYCEADRVKWFLKDFQDYIEDNFSPLYETEIENDE